MKHLHSNKKLLDEYSGENKLITYLGAITAQVSASGTVTPSLSLLALAHRWFLGMEPVRTGDLGVKLKKEEHLFVTYNIPVVLK